MRAADLDDLIRLAAFDYIAEQTRRYGEVLPHAVLRAGFPFGSERVNLVGQTGIFKPKQMTLPLTLKTVPSVEGRPRPYEDVWLDDDRVLYRYRGSDPNTWDNVGVRRAMELQKPLIYLFGIASGEYTPLWPTYVVDDDPVNLAFTLEFGASEGLLLAQSSSVAEPTRRYATRLTRQRLHQVAFRERVIRAYQQRCSVCRLKRRELLDAAHIIPDADPLGVPVVSNGLSLCKLHHAAFDGNILGVRPDLVIEIREDVLDETDGPMLVHGLQGFNGERLTVPTRMELRPRPELLEVRYDRFRQAG